MIWECSAELIYHTVFVLSCSIHCCINKVLDFEFWSTVIDLWLLFFNSNRINALVDQEVKRRLFEEKVDREKQRRMEREKEKREREREIQKLKSMHEKEMKLLREKLEDNNGVHKKHVGKGEVGTAMM